MIYLDNAATTRIDGEVIDAMMPYLTNLYGNPGSLYSLGQTALQAVDKAREQVACFLNCQHENVIFTSGGSEGNSFVLYGVLDHLDAIGKDTIVTSMGEHDSVIRALEDISHMEYDANGIVKTRFHIEYLPIGNGGKISIRDLREELITNRTGLVSIMYVNNELGTVNPVSEIGEICMKKGILFHTDCVQAAGTYPLDVEEIGCDFLTISSHKIHGPKGVGAVYVRNPNNIKPLVRGGADQEFGLRGGTENVAGIVGFGKACEIMKKKMREIDVHTSAIKQNFYRVLTFFLAEHGLEHIVHVNGEPVIHSGKILNLRFDGVDAETLILMADSLGICLSAGSACHSHASEPSRVLLAAGLLPDEARSSVRISFSKQNTAEEVEDAAKKIAECVSVLHGNST